VGRGSKSSTLDASLCNLQDRIPFLAKGCVMRWASLNPIATCLLEMMK
jgi:hypothetical protein